MATAWYPAHATSAPAPAGSPRAKGVVMAASRRLNPVAGTARAGQDSGMPAEPDPLLDRARAAWCGYARTALEFPASGFAVAVSESSVLCPPGWVGIVELGRAGIATVPSPELAAPVTTALAAHGFDGAAGRLPVRDTLGPATLAFLAPGDFTAPVPGTPVEVLPDGDAGLLELFAGTDPEELDESGVAGLPELCALRVAGRVVAVAGYARWPGEVAHLCVLTADGYRGQGFAQVVAAAAVAAALAADLLPQWRARPVASRRVARALGFRELGRQLSLQLSTGTA